MAVGMAVWGGTIGMLVVATMTTGVCAARTGIWVVSAMTCFSAQLYGFDIALTHLTKGGSSESRATPSEDAWRRDLTINSLFYNLHTRMVEDWTGKV